MKKLIVILAVAAMATTASALELRAAWDTLLGRQDRAPKPALLNDVNMGSGVFRVTGYGAAPADAVSPAQARLMAVGAAKLDALKKLAALLEGVDLSSQSESGDFVQTRYAVREQTRGFLKGVRVLQTRYCEDGTAEVDVEVVLARSNHGQDFSSPEGYRIQPGRLAVYRDATVFGREPDVTIREGAPARGDEDVPEAGPAAPETSSPDSPAVEEVIAPYEPAPEAGPPAEATAAPTAPVVANPEAAEPEPPIVALVGPPADVRVDDITVALPQRALADDGAYTDLVVDARGLGAMPVLEPRAVTKKGEQVFPLAGGILDHLATGKEPTVRYARTMDEARSIPGFGARPLVIQAAGLGGESNEDIVLGRVALLKLTPLLESRLAQGEGFVVILID